MRVSKLRLRNFLSFGDERQDITFDSTTTIVGPNDAGKTNIFRALTFVGELLRNEGGDLRPFYYRGETDRSLEVRVDVEFDQIERQALTDFFVCSALMSEIQTTQNPAEAELMAKAKAELNKGAGRTIYAGLFSKTSLQISGRLP